MNHIGFKLSHSDPDVWMREGIKEDGSQHWEYVLLYVDDCLCISANAEYVLRNKIGKYFKLKEASIGPPDKYLGGKMRQVEMENGTSTWSFSSSQYVQAVVKNVETYLKEKLKKFPTVKQRLCLPVNIDLKLILQEN